MGAGVMMGAVRKFGLIGLISVAMTTVAVGQDSFNPPPSSSTSYYGLGGATAVGDGLNPQVAVKVLDVDGTKNLPTACDIWKNRENLPEYLEAVIRDYIGNTFDIDGFVTQIMTAVQAGGAMIAVYALQRALPGLYDWMTVLNGLVDSELDISLESCNSALSNMRNGAGPFSAWIDVSAGKFWQNTMSSTYPTDKSINEVTRDEAAFAGRDTPLPWFGGEKGNKGNPIRLTRGVVGAGFGTHAGGSAEFDDSGIINAPDTVSDVIVADTAPAERSTRMKELFPTSDDAISFAVAVVGEVAAEWCPDTDCGGEFTPGIGLKSVYDVIRSDMITEWNNLFANYPIGDGAGNNPKLDELKKISSGKTRMTVDIYNTVRLRTDRQDIPVVAGRLASDAALELTIEKAMALRELIKSGSDNPVIQQYNMSKSHAEKINEKVKAAIEDLMWEIEVNQSLGHRTASTLIEIDTIKRRAQAGRVTGEAGTGDAPVFTGGEVQ